MIASMYSSFAQSYLSGPFLILELVFFVLVVAGIWMVFIKAGRHGWAAIIPFYNLWTLVKVADRPVWYFWVMLILAFIPIVNIATIVMLLIVDIDVCRHFGHGAGYGVLLWLFPFVMYPVLGFGKSQYLGLITSFSHVTA